MARGRDKDLVAARDRRLFERYYYWTEVKRLRFDDTIRKLSEEEFFLSEGRIIQIIRRMILDGETVDGSAIPSSQFSGFRVAARQRKPRRTASEPSLFP